VIVDEVAKDILVVVFYLDAVYTLRNVADCHSKLRGSCASEEELGKKTSQILLRLLKNR
jgi:hypothetical protein